MRTGKQLEFDGESHTMKEWSEISGVAVKTIRARLYAGWDLEDAIFKPSKRGPHCTATAMRDCFECPFDDCVRDVPLPETEKG